MPSLCVTHEEDDRFTVSVREHQLAVDQPLAAGGSDQGLSPVEMFVASIAACIGHYARRYLHRHGLAEDPLAVSAHWTVAEKPARIASMRFHLSIAEEIPPDRRRAVLAMANRCTLHNTLAMAPEISIDLAGVDNPAA